jgi:phage tail tube protein FII
MVGSAEFFAGIDKLECKIKWNSLYPEVLKKAANPFKHSRLSKIFFEHIIAGQIQEVLQLHIFQDFKRVSSWQ